MHLGQHNGLAMLLSERTYPAGLLNGLCFYCSFLLNIHHLLGCIMCREGFLEACKILKVLGPL